MKIKKIHIKNFKLFENFSIKFADHDLIVFDGPNGFGKTSLYDAIELLFTGSLRRYDKLVKNNVDHRKSVNGNPLLNDASEIGDLIIKGELEIGGETICLMRKSNRNILKNASRMDEYELQLYSLPQFDSEEISLVIDEPAYLTNILGEDYRQNFQFLNYIAQEENTYLLKKGDEARKDAIGHLFNTLKFEMLIGKLDESSKKIGELCGAPSKNALTAQKSILEESRTKFSGDRTAVPYKKIVTWKDLAWDAEKLESTDAQYVEWLGADGELAKLISFLENVEQFKKDRENKKFDQLFVNELLVTQLLQYWNFIEHAEAFSTQLVLQNSIKALLSAYEEGALKAMVQGKVALSSQLKELAGTVVEPQAYSDSIGRILNFQKNATALSKLLIEVKDSRKAFIDKFLQYEAEIKEENTCPLCGHSWQDAEELKVHFDSQAEQLEELIIASDSNLNLAIENFTADFIVPLSTFFKGYLLKNSVNDLFVENLKAANANRTTLSSLNQKFVELNFDLKSFFNNEPIAVVELKLDDLRAQFNEKKHAINSDQLQPFFDSIYLKIFNESLDHIFLIEKSEIAEKRKYIEWQYSLHQSASINKLQKDYDKQLKQFDNAHLLKSKISTLKKIYETSLQEYQKSLIEDIEIIFHIYSGRISQDYQGGLGLFIASEKNGIRFLENPKKSHDAVFTMSSGQLSALVISFTLALNKRYSKNNLLFIDDPVQTLDELNIAGFVDLLRHEFFDRQIFISTHEDMMSAYMRYKFQRFGLKTERVNFKERQFAISEY